MRKTNLFAIALGVLLLFEAFTPTADAQWGRWRRGGYYGGYPAYSGSYYAPSYYAPSYYAPSYYAPSYYTPSYYGSYPSYYGGNTYPSYYGGYSYPNSW